MPAIVDVAAYSARISQRTVWTFVRVRDADGRYGWGEATLQGEAAVVHAQVERLGSMLVDRPLPSSLEVLAAMDIRGVCASEAAAISATDQAIRDVEAQVRGQSLAAMLGAPCRTTIELYANINRGTVDRSPSGFAARATEASNSGFDAIKIAPFDDVVPESADTPAGRRLLTAGVERVAAVRSAIGPGKRLLVDCHWRLTEAAAGALLREMEPYGLYWLECPLDEGPSTFPALRRLRARANAIGVRLAGCESMTGVDVFRSFLDAGAYDVIMPDVKYAGGMIEMLRIGEVATARGVLCSPHNPSGPIAHVHSLHISSLLASLPFLELQYGETPLFFSIVDGAMPDPRHGTSALPAGHGLGIGIDMARWQPLAAAVSIAGQSERESATSTSQTKET